MEAVLHPTGHARDDVPAVEVMAEPVKMYGLLPGQNTNDATARQHQAPMHS